VIVLETSALMAIALDEPEAARCSAAVENAPALCISAVTLAEALIVSSRRGVRHAMDVVLEGLDVDVVPLDAARARRAARAYDRWGRGVHPAALNLGDCFAYALAEERACPLLFVGDDFARTDAIAA
jgi:ribonuclease VapC